MTAAQPKRVYIVNGDYAYRTMFESHGWDVVDKAEHADLVQFTGGEDVTPWLYGEPAHRTTGYNWTRDIREIFEYGMALEMGIPMAGICRGGQFLNVMCGGRMYQDVGNHAIHGTHPVEDWLTGKIFDATSTHHQMMRVGPLGQIVAVAAPKRSNHRVTAYEQFHDIHEPEAEIIYYQRQKCLCFQPHPEIPGYKILAGLYFEYLRKYLGV